MVVMVVVVVVVGGVMESASTCTGISGQEEYFRAGYWKTLCPDEASLV